jgi:hypothetical protein
MQPKKATVSWQNACVEQLSAYAPAMLAAILQWRRPWALAWRKHRVPVTRLYGPAQPSGKPVTIVAAGTAPGDTIYPTAFH